MIGTDLTRRAFLHASTVAVGGLALGSCRYGDELAATRLRILILGGTGFVGPNQVRAALARGHEVTLFNRGQTNPDLFPDLETLIGDRDGDLAALEGREWDVVIDNSANIPRWVRLSTEALSGSVAKYLFVSSTGVYIPYLTTDIHEDAPVDTIEDPETEMVDGRTFGALKALAEDAARDAFPDGHLVLRPTYIVGPGDPTDRYTYWPVRLSRGGEVLAPGTPDDPMQHVDVRDLAAFMIKAVEDDLTGTMNIVGPREPLTMGSLLERTRAAIGSDATLVWVDATFLQDHDLPALTYWTRTVRRLPRHDAGQRRQGRRRRLRDAPPGAYRRRDAGMVQRPGRRAPGTPRGPVPGARDRTDRSVSGGAVGLDTGRSTPEVDRIGRGLPIGDDPVDWSERDGIQGD